MSIYSGLNVPALAGLSTLMPQRFVTWSALMLCIVTGLSLPMQSIVAQSNPNATQPSAQQKILVVGDQVFSGQAAEKESKTRIFDGLTSLGFEPEFISPGEVLGKDGGWYLDASGAELGPLTEQLKAVIKQSSPDLVVIHFGSEMLADFNRRDYQNALKAMVDAVMNTKPEAMVFMAEIPPSQMMDARTQRMVGMAVRNVARVYMRRGQLYTFDVEDGWVKKDHGAPEGVPTAAGYQKIADALLPMIFEQLPVTWSRLKVPVELKELKSELAAGHLGQAQLMLSNHLMMTDGTTELDRWAELVSDRIIVESNRDDDRMKDMIEHGKYQEADQLAQQLSVKYDGMQISLKFKEAAGNVIEQAAEQQLMRGVDAFQRKQFKTARSHFQQVLDEFPDSGSAPLAKSMLAMDMPQEDVVPDEMNIFGE